MIQLYGKSEKYSHANSCSIRMGYLRLDLVTLLDHILDWLPGSLRSTVYVLIDWCRLLCYAYLIYYTGLNLLSRSKYYINLSHNLIKWIFLGVVSCSGILFDKLFKFNLLSRITIMVLTGLIVYPSRRMQRLHLSLAIRNKDKIYEKRRDDPIASGLSIFQKFLNSITGMFLSLANLTLKLIHPDNRTPDV